jgi:fatty-acyl-CoA synthase
MQDYPLTVRMIFDRGRQIFSTSEIVTFEDTYTRRASFEEVASRVVRLASALDRLGIGAGDRVGTLCWNTQEHVEAYFAIPLIGAVLHTLNLRLFPDQLTYVINHAADRVIIVDGSLVPTLARVLPALTTVEQIIVVGGGDASALGRHVLRYDDLIANGSATFEWPEMDERSAAGMCYTTGTTGDPKGVVYSHRSTVLHTFGGLLALGMNERERILPVVPMFHANAWGLPYEAWFCGADLVMPSRFLQPEPLCRLIAQERVTYTGAVPTVWNDVLRYAEQNPVDFSSLRTIVCGGSAVPKSLIERFRDRFGVSMLQGWGMTETSPVGAVSHPPKGRPPEQEMDWRAKTGRVIAGIELRIVDDESNVLPWDGETVGEIEVRGPWVTGSYYQDDAPDKFDDGWLRTGDVGSVDRLGFVQITDRAKDVVKSGGEWISSMEIENHLMAHPDVVEAAVIGVPDDRWDERPLAVVVVRPSMSTDADDLRGFLADKIARWWLPERWTFVPELPKTSVGKFDKKALRAEYQAGRFNVVLAGVRPESKTPA